MADDPTSPQTPYVVLARKYRPLTFQSLIGQDAMVRTLGNAFKAGRIHHAFILTGVRGVGKTTTARILARAFNYVDETGPHPTLELEKEGEHCRAIIEGRHVDVHEMDAASNTGVDDVREIIESVRYGPVSAPYKVFVIDEVHMLSNNAFNALLKTLEEPPPYVKFIFATTEIRKVPVTILSRCQRFDLRRITPDIMTPYLSGLLEKEGLDFEPDALAMIVRAGEGSVRDCLSLLDQAIAYGGGTVRAEDVRAMLGLADRAAILDLFALLMHGDIAAALDANRALYNAGAGPDAILTDLANLTHLVTRLKLVPTAADDPGLTPDERARGPEMAGKLGVRALTRTWQILIKGIEEVARATNAIQAAEMVLIRLTHAADLPTPDEVIEKLGKASVSATPAPQGGTPAPSGGARARLAVAPQPVPFAEAPPAVTPVPDPKAETAKLAQPQSFAELVRLAGLKRDLTVKYALEADIRPVNFSQGRIEVQLVEGADPAIIKTLSARLKIWTGQTWLVTMSNGPATIPTLREQREAEARQRDAAAFDDPLVQAVFDAFPGAQLVNVRVREDEPVAEPDTFSDEDDESEDE